MFDKLDSPDILDMEAMSWSGDSGGPALIKDKKGNWKIAGVNNSGECCGYGSKDNYARLGDVALEWIKANMIEAKDAEKCEVYGEAELAEEEDGSDEEGGDKDGGDEEGSDEDCEDWDSEDEVCLDDYDDEECEDWEYWDSYYEECVEDY